MKLRDLYKKKSLCDYIMYAAILVAGVIIDQLTKWLAVKYLIPVGSVSLIKFGEVQVLNFTYVENTGAAFGMLKNAPWVFNSISVTAIIVMLAYLFLGHTESKLSGATLHYVVDFIDFRLINFAVFNGADTFVCVGAGLLVLGMILEMKEEMKKEKLAGAGAEAVMENEE